MNILDFLNSNSGSVQAVATVVLVGITAFYAAQTRKTNKLAAKTNELISMQIFPNIFLIPDKLFSNLLKPNFISDIKNSITESTTAHRSYGCIFNLDYSIHNHSASSGSIERPKLLIKNPQYKYKKVLNPEINPVFQSACRGEVENTIYLRAGETKNMKEVFCFSVIFPNPKQDDVNFINNIENLEYVVLYKNVLGEELSIKLSNKDVLPPKS